MQYAEKFNDNAYYLPEAENLLREEGELISLMVLALGTSSGFQVQSPGFSPQAATGNRKVLESV